MNSENGEQETDQNGAEADTEREWEGVLMDLLLRLLGNDEAQKEDDDDH